MSAFITNIRQNTDYYCKKAMECFEAQDILSSIKYLNKAEELALGGEKYEIYFIQGMMYSRLEMYERSNEYFLLSTFSFPLQVKAFIAIFENMISMERLDLAENYKTMLSYHPGVKKDEREDINIKFEKALADLKPKIKLANIEDTDKFRKDYQKSVEMMCDSDFLGAIELMGKYSPKDSQKARDILTNAYVLLGEYDKAESIAHADTMTVEDKCNLILCYFLAEDRKKEFALIDELLKCKTLSKEDTYRFALRLAKVGENLTAIKVFEKYFSLAPYDDYAKIIYSMVCMDEGLFTKAKNTLISFLPVALFDRGIYDELLKKCEAKEPANFINNIDLWHIVDKKYKSRITWLNGLNDEEFAVAVKNFEKEILWLATAKDKYLRNTFFTRYCTLEGSSDVINKMLVCDDVDVGTKLIIINKRLDSGINDNIMFTRNEMFTGFLRLSDNLSNNKVYFRAYTLLINRIIDSNQQGLFDFGFFIKRAQNLYKDSIDNPYILAAIISWDIDKTIKRKTIKSICSYFGVSEEDFWKYYKEDED